LSDGSKAVCRLGFLVEDKDMGIERFEDIEAWKAARELSQEVYKITAQGQFTRDYGLRDQIQRAAISIMANIAEGFDGRF